MFSVDGAVKSLLGIAAKTISFTTIDRTLLSAFNDSLTSSPENFPQPTGLLLFWMFNWVKKMEQGNVEEILSATLPAQSKDL